MVLLAVGGMVGRLAKGEGMTAATALSPLVVFDSSE